MLEAKPYISTKVLGPSAPWHVVHTKSRQEKAVADVIQGMGLEGFLPLTRKVRYHGLRKQRVELPLFTGYIFLRASVEDSYRLDRSGRIAQIIRVRDQEGLVRELDRLRLAMDHDGTLTEGSLIERGMWVEVRAGPFRGLQGQVDRQASDDRLSLAVQILGRAADLEIDRSLLEPIDVETSWSRAV